jgi:hypothetical protein
MVSRWLIRTLVVAILLPAVPGCGGGPAPANPELPPNRETLFKPGGYKGEKRPPVGIAQ